MRHADIWRRTIWAEETVRAKTEQEHAYHVSVTKEASVSAAKWAREIVAEDREIILMAFAQA